MSQILLKSHWVTSDKNDIYDGSDVVLEINGVNNNLRKRFVIKIVINIIIMLVSSHGARRFCFI